MEPIILDYGNCILFSAASSILFHIFIFFFLAEGGEGGCFAPSNMLFLYILSNIYIEYIFSCQGKKLVK